MRKPLLAVLALAIAGPAMAQSGGGMGGMGGMRMPPPDHWMTMDSVSQALTLTAAERTAIQAQYDSINLLLKRGVAIRDSIRGSMGQGGDMRAAMGTARQLLQPLQDQEDALVKAIRGHLTADQAAKLDAAPPPRVLRQPRGGMGGAPPGQ
jgi:hypothetical protein